jgi:GNAT superfamily N-acetyltransferase/catechol 2,3-dioxygenase-like lactoylglutathione lyase family enzyme
VISHLDEWWGGGRHMTDMLPRLFFEHFADTSIVAAVGDGPPLAFLVGLVSRTDPTAAYIHFVGVDPEARGTGVGRRLYEWFFERAASLGCSSVGCVTSPLNTGSRAFHSAMGFTEEQVEDYDGLGEPRMKFRRELDRAAGGPANLQLVTIVVDEYDPAVEFFVGVLGFDLVEDVPSETNDSRPKRWVVVRPRGGTTGVLLARADGDVQSAVVGEQTAGRVGFFLHVADFDATRRRLESAGVEFTSPVREMPYGRVTVFRDIAGNKWDLLGA